MMTAIEVSFLTGRYVATAHHDREAFEWPPHGARLFSAMVAAWADAEQPDAAERAALEWLEGLPPPRITAPPKVERRTVSHYVPVNDARVISGASYDNRAERVGDLIAQWEDELEASEGEITKQAERLHGRIDKQRNVESLVDEAGNTNPASALGLLPDGRLKKERHFPSVTLVGNAVPEGSPGLAPNQPPPGLGSPVTFSWDEGAPPEIAEALDRLLERVTRLGHSSSLVSCRFRTVSPAATHVPGNGGTMLRWVRPGQLAALEEEHRRHKAIRPRGLPFWGVSYRTVDEAPVAPSGSVTSSEAGEWIVFEIEPSHRRWPITRTVEVAQALRKSVLRYVADPLPEGVSGHLPDGTPTERPHLAFLALPNVGHEHGDGRIMGLALSVPDGLDEAARKATLRGIGLWERDTAGEPLRLTMGAGGLVAMRRRQPPFSLVSLRRHVWARPSRRWVSVTPIALPTHPGNLRKGTAAARAKAWARAEDSVAASCVHLDLPSPVDAQVSFVSRVVGARAAADYPAFRQGRGGGGVPRRLLHATIEFAEPVSGPLLLGSGRFLGLGLMRPITEIHGAGATASEGSRDD